MRRPDGRGLSDLSLRAAERRRNLIALSRTRTGVLRVVRNDTETRVPWRPRVARGGKRVSTRKLFAMARAMTSDQLPRGRTASPTGGAARPRGFGLAGDG